jgi:hypothetical protein
MNSLEFFLQALGIKTFDESIDQSIDKNIDTTIKENMDEI